MNKLKRDGKPKCASCGCNKSMHRYTGSKKGFCFMDDCGCLGYSIWT